MTYSTCNGHLSRALRSAATSCPFNGSRLGLAARSRESPAGAHAGVREEVLRMGPENGLRVPARKTKRGSVGERPQRKLGGLPRPRVPSPLVPLQLARSRPRRRVYDRAPPFLIASSRHGGGKAAAISRVRRCIVLERRPFDNLRPLASLKPRLLSFSLSRVSDSRVPSELPTPTFSRLHSRRH